jgi:hypothetical protein
MQARVANVRGKVFLSNAIFASAAKLIALPCSICRIAAELELIEKCRMPEDLGQ